MTQIQLDLCALDSFRLFDTEGLHEYLSSNGWYLSILPEAMARHGFAGAATVLEKVRLLLPLKVSAEIDDDIGHVIHNHLDKVHVLGAELEKINVDYEAAIDSIFRERMADLPEPLEILPGKWVVNPFKPGEKMYVKPRYPT